MSAQEEVLATYITNKACVGHTCVGRARLLVLVQAKVEVRSIVDHGPDRTEPRLVEAEKMRTLSSKRTGC